MDLGFVHIDTDFDVRSDSGGRDPDAASATLKKFHKILWNKKLPNGEMFKVSDNLPSHYLLGQTNSRSISLSSDTICNSYLKRKSIQSIIETSDQRIDLFRKKVYSVGGFILFPAKKVDGLNTINQERGWLKSIDDRFDLTLECIRLFYLSQNSPLFPVLSRYSDFFEIFVDFRGYVTFFLLQDMVSKDFKSINYFLPVEIPFSGKPLPQTRDDYYKFMHNAQEFLQARNQRILSWVNKSDKKSQ
jgi:hypothetical protein